MEEVNQTNWSGFSDVLVGIINRYLNTELKTSLFNNGSNLFMSVSDFYKFTRVIGK
jgi:hypothetical protein